MHWLSFLYYFLLAVGSILLARVIAVVIAFQSEDYLGEFGLVVGWIIGLVAAGTLLLLVKRITPYFEKLDEKVEQSKKRPFTEKYGKDYPLPKPEDFGITRAEFDDYNKRFQFEYIKLLLTYGVWLATCIYVIREDLKRTWLIILIASSIIFGVLMEILLTHINLKLSQKHPSYPKINKFQKAMGIYHKISDENSNI